MKRSVMRAYVQGAAQAIALYEAAFDAKLLDLVRASDGSIYHSELDVYGQCDYLYAGLCR